MQPFIVSAESKSEPGRMVVFLVEAGSHRDAWQTARRVAHTGLGAQRRDQETDELVPIKLAPDEFTVRRVLSAEAGHRRGRPPKITTDDLLAHALRRRVSIPPRVARVIRELETAVQ